MRFGTKTTDTEPGTDPEATMARVLRRAALIGTVVVAVYLLVSFLLEWLGWTTRGIDRVTFSIVYSFCILLIAFVTITQMRYYRRTGQNRFGLFGISRRAWEIRQIGFLVAAGSFALGLFGVPPEILAPFFIAGVVASIVGFAGIMGSSLGTGFATLGVLLSVGAALYNALAGTDYTKPIIQSVIYAGMGLVAVGMVIFFVRRWRRRNESMDGNDPTAPGSRS